MAKRTVLYIDVDDTIIAVCCFGAGTGFDLRPNVITQLRFLSRMFDCRWLTCWPNDRLRELMRLLYAPQVNQKMQYCDWSNGHPQRKAGYVLAPGAPEDFYWLEDPLTKEEISALEEAG